ncbi:hypothetical protein XELAEV_18003633mg [Xenopus laevis]|uniref:Uncharacterized protein n=1 Tax=Xenopus laevis TaxID=8355 RepID=A0A974BNI5_XENLA|nr:hypothetical protein XELAEV_18003633mg [Xenopus laevis]
MQRLPLVLKEQGNSDSPTSVQNEVRNLFGNKPATASQCGNCNLVKKVAFWGTTPDIIISEVVRYKVTLPT